MPTIKPYRAEARDAHEADVTVDSHGLFTIDEPQNKSTSVSIDSIEPPCTDARARAANRSRSRSRSPLRSAHRQSCTMHTDRRATPDVAPSQLHRPSDAWKHRRNLRMAETAKFREHTLHEVQVMEMKMDLLKVLESALESGFVVLVDSFENSDWKAYENTTVKTVAPYITWWAALGKLVTFVCASLRRARTSP